MAILTRYRSWKEIYRFCCRFRAGRNDRYKKDTGIILYNTSNYVFNFTSEADRKDLKEMMEEKRSRPISLKISRINMYMFQMNVMKDDTYCAGTGRDCSTEEKGLFRRKSRWRESIRKVL